MTFGELEARVRASLGGSLPGLAAHLRMAPEPRPGWTPGRTPASLRGAAALLLLFPVDASPHLLLTVRSSDLPKHAGQVSLPGGGVEPDETIEDAALREAHEEVGINRGDVELLGRMTPLHIPVSGYILHPVVGVARSRPDLRVEASEVAQVLEPSVGVLVDPRTRRQRPRMREDGFFQNVPYFEIGGYQVWGATAMILSEFLALLGETV
jgi:8-oxo-dGTP pyrophosphatase MutT (NUDIX family)